MFNFMKASGNDSELFPDLKYLNHHITFLRYSGLWPPDEMHGRTGKLDSLRVIMLLLTIGGVPVTAAMLHAMRYLPESLVDVLEDFVLIGAFGFCCTFALIMLKIYSNLVIFMGTFYERYPKPKNIDAMEKKHQKDLKLYLSGLFIGITTNLIYVVANTGNCYLMRNGFNHFKSCGFLTPAWLPFDYEHGFVRVFLLFTQYITLLYFPSIMVTHHMIFVTIVDHTTAALDTLLSRIANIDIMDGTESTESQLSRVIELYVVLYRTVGRLEKMVQLSSLLLGVGCIMNSGLLIILILVVISPNALMILVIWFFDLSYMMALSQKIIDKSNDINEAFYNLPWYEMDPKSKNLIYFTLMRTQKPLTVRNVFFDMSLRTLLLIGSKAYSMTTFLLQVARDGN